MKNTHLQFLTAFGLSFTLIAQGHLLAEEPVPTRELRDLNKSYFPFTPVQDKAAWESRSEEIRQRVLLASGLWPMPERTLLNTMIHGRIEREDYIIDKVFFESLPGHFVTGNLYLPKNHGDKIPAVLCPHGHWPDGRFMDDQKNVAKQIASGAEKFENGARSPLQARCVQLARMGCAVFFYDMLGYADSVQFCDASGKALHRHGVLEKGFLSPEAELNLCGYFPLQIWNGERALDFLTSLPFVDQSRVGCTGASGGGTQTLILSGIDQRIKAAFPCVMTSTAMQGGCTCENSSYLRIHQGNVDIAALTAPRPLGMTAADDWTKELEQKGFPELKNLYTMLGVPERVEAHFNLQFPHNFNAVSRGQMYHFFNQYFALGLSETALEERDFKLSNKDELSVWDEKHPAPTGNQVGTAHELAVIDWFKKQSKAQLTAARHFTGSLEIIADKPDEKGLDIIRTAWQIMIGSKLPSKGESTYSLGTKEDHGDHFVLHGVTHCNKNEVDGAFIYPKNWNNSVVLWLSLKGEESLMTKSGELHAAARKLLGEGYAIACPELYLQGATKNPNVYAGRKQPYEGFAGYHYGYNPSLFAERVRDALSFIAMIRDNEHHNTQHILVAGLEGAGAIAAATTALAGTSVDSLVLDSEGFRFAKLSDVWDVNFVPGAVKYGDLPWLLELCKKAKLMVLDIGGAEAVVDGLIKP